MSSVRTKVVTMYWDEVSFPTGHCYYIQRVWRHFFDMHFTDPDGALRLHVSFLLVGHMGVPVHMPCLTECFLTFVLFLSPDHLPLVRACQTPFWIRV